MVDICKVGYLQHNSNPFQHMVKEQNSSVTNLVAELLNQIKQLQKSNFFP